MKIIICLFIFNLLFQINLFSQNHLPYKLGEKLKYDVSFLGFKVGDGTLNISSIEKIDEKTCFHIIGQGKTSSFFDFFFKVRDKYETYLDTSLILPVKFRRDISEGGFKKQQLYTFNHSDSIVFFEDSSCNIFGLTQDMLSALFFARTFSSDSIIKNDAFNIPIFMDEENYMLQIKYLKKDTIMTNFGKIECLVFQPLMQEGRVFEDGEKMRVWITNDKNHLLVKVETQIWAGKIDAIITEIDKIKYPLRFVTDN